MDDRVGYFVIQTRATAGLGVVRLAIVLEDLGSGVKHRFESPEGLLEFLVAWQQSPTGVDP